MSGAGKSTLAHAIEEKLYHMGCRTFVFDGDNVRHGLCSYLGFSPEEFTGISAPYEVPENPELHLKTDIMSLKECVDIVTSYLLEQKIIKVLSEKSNSLRRRV